MKSSTKWIIIILIASCIFSMSSCMKPSVPVPLDPSVNVSVGYITSMPTDQTRIPIKNSFGMPLGTATISGSWQDVERIWKYLQNHVYAVGFCGVDMVWDNKWTNGDWSGHIVGIR